MARPRLSKQSITGNLVSDPVTRTVANKSMVTMRVADNNRHFDRDANEWVNGDPTFYDVAITKAQLGKNVLDSLHKGDPVTVRGGYEASPYVTNTGEPALNHRIWADDVAVSLDYATATVQRNPAPGGAGLDTARPELGNDPTPSYEVPARPAHSPGI